MRPYLIVCCIAGIVIPYWFALPFFLIHGPNFRLFVEEIFATRISSFFAADLILSSVIFLGWSLIVEFGGVAFWTLETGRPFLHHGSGNPLYMSLGLTANPYNIVWDDDGTMSDSPGSCCEATIRSA